MRSGSRLSFSFVTGMTTAASTLYAFCAFKPESSDSAVAKHKLLDKSTHRDSKSVRRESGNGFNSNKIRAVYFFYRFSTGCLIPFMTLYMQYKGLSPNEIGSLQAIRPIVTLLCGPFWGSWSDRCGHKKTMLLFLYISSVVFRLCICFIGDSRSGFAIGLCASSMFYSAVPSILDSIVVSSMPESDRTNFGRMRLWGELGNGVASSIMMSVVSRESYGFEFLFSVHAISSCTALACLVLFVPEGSSMPADRHAIESERPQSSFEWKEKLLVIITDIQILTLFSLVVLMGYTLGFIENFCYINIRQIYKDHGQLGIVGRDVSICRIFLSIGGILSWFYAGSWGKRFGTGLVMCAAVSCLPFCFFLYAGVTSELNFWTKAGFFLAESIRSGVYAALWSTATVRLNELSPPHMKSTMQSMMESTYRGFGHTSGAFFGGVLCRKYSVMSEAFMVAGKGLLSFLVVVGTAIYIFPEKS